MGPSFLNEKQHPCPTFRHSSVCEHQASPDGRLCRGSLAVENHPPRAVHEVGADTSFNWRCLARGTPGLLLLQVCLESLSRLVFLPHDRIMVSARLGNFVV